MIQDATQCALDEYDAGDVGRGVDEKAVASENCVIGTERGAARGSVQRFIDAARKLQREV